VNTNAEFDPALGWQAGIALDHAVLHFDGAAHGIDDAPEFDQSTVPGSLHDAAVMHGRSCIDRLSRQAKRTRNRWLRSVAFDPTRKSSMHRNNLDGDDFQFALGHPLASFDRWRSRSTPDHSINGHV